MKTGASAPALAAGGNDDDTLTKYLGDELLALLLRPAPVPRELRDTTPPPAKAVAA